MAPPSDSIPVGRPSPSRACSTIAFHISSVLCHVRGITLGVRLLRPLLTPLELLTRDYSRAQPCSQAYLKRAPPIRACAFNARAGHLRSRGLNQRLRYLVLTRQPPTPSMTFVSLTRHICPAIGVSSRQQSGFLLTPCHHDAIAFD